ncbi:MAG: translesion DNA synthesis-associated protein ImuA [Gammaproteobacteria bacterium]|nr:translesion DNA synthesis-associated protein ImuA [Gammaproteobacteria bacterium]MDH3467231.1 translesion DNA synthesis-associated protein ImuA [Gammaproteobacteria bacterium]
MTQDLFEHRADIWRGGNTPPTVRDGIPTGFDVLDRLFPGGGWPRGALTEILTEEGTSALQLLMPALAQLSHSHKRWITWVAPPHIPYAPALANGGIDLSKILLIHPRRNTDLLWALEQALRSGTCSVVLAWLAGGNDKILRRLQLAAETGRTAGLLFCPPRNVEQHSTAALRVQVDPSPDGLTVDIIKRRGGWPAGPVHFSGASLHAARPH